MAIGKLPAEIISIVCELVVLSNSVLEILQSGPNVKLAQVNRFFRSVAVNTPIIWGSVSNKQHPDIFRLCMKRSKQSRLGVVLLLVDHGTDNYIEFLRAVVPHAPRWEEFHFETGRSLSDYLRIIHDLPIHCSGLKLPQLRKLTALYPDALFYDTDYGRVPYADEYYSYNTQSAQARNHFYSSWVTPRLQELQTRNIVPYHTDGAELTSCDIRFETSCSPEWRAEPLLSMYPHWARLTSLTLRCHSDILYTDEPPTLGTIVLPHLEHISLSLNARAQMDHLPWLLDILDFPNVISVDVTFNTFLSWAFSTDNGSLQFAPDNVRALLRDGTDYSKLEHLTLSLNDSEAVIFTAVFSKVIDGPNVKISFAASHSSHAELSNGDPSGVKSIACTREMSDLLRMQSGWQGLSDMTIVHGSEEKTELVRTAFPGWSVHHQSDQEVELEPEYKYKYLDEPYTQVSIDRGDLHSESSDSWATILTDDEDDIFVGLLV